ncbi:MAG: AzlD domain-containing protein [Thermodesulfobacteriota bacterium]
MREERLLLIFGMAIVTFLPRFIPMAFFSRWAIPEKVRMGLEYIPVSILSAILFPMLLFDGEGTFGIQPQFLISSIPVFAFAWKTKNLWGSVIIGMVIYWGLGFIL